MKHNIYKNEKFQNIEFSDNNSDKSVGVVEPGKYNFTTEREEKVECISGEIIINNKKLKPGDSIVIGPKEDFTISTQETSAYLCLYQ